MLDRAGNPIAVGDRVYVMPEKQVRTGGPGFVRMIKGGMARIDDGPKDMPDLDVNNDQWSWSSWCNPKEIEKI